MRLDNRRALVLCVSHDVRLLDTRRLVLARRYEAVAELRIDAIEELPEDEVVDVVVLCHTLSTEECLRAAEMARQRWPGVKVVALTTDQMRPVGFADRMVKSFEGPAGLFRGIDEALAA